MGRDNDGGRVRRRTAFERDLRELGLKIVVGLLAGLGIYAFSGWTGSIWVPLLIGVAAVFFLASLIKGDGRHADD